MIPFCLFQCNSNRMSAAAFGPVQALSAACPARPRSPHGRRALAAPTRRCAVTDDTLPQTLHRHRHYTATDAAALSRRYAATDATPPPTLRRPRRYTATDATPPHTLHRSRCYTTLDATPSHTLHRSRCYTATDTAPLPMPHRPRRCAVPTIRCHRCYTATNATPPQTLHRHRHCTAPDAAPPSTLSCPDATPCRRIPLASHTQYDIDPMK